MFDQIKSYYKKSVPGLQEADWVALQQKFTIQQLKKGDLLTRNGEVCRQGSFINKGLVRMFYRVNGREIYTGFIAENNYVA